MPWLLVVAGWWIVSHQNNTRERRKDIRELTRFLSTELDAVIHNWLSYNLIDGSSPEALALAVKVKTGISAVRSSLTRISQAGLIFDVDADFIEIKKQLTGDRFESKDRLHTDFDENKHALVCTLAQIIVRSIEKSYFDTYSSGIHKFINLDLIFSGLNRIRRYDTRY